MSEFKLSILICTLPERKDYLNRIMNILRNQVKDIYERQTLCEVLNCRVEIIIDSTPRGQITTGEKRNKLIDMAGGDYIVFVDDDDIVSPFYVEEILKASKYDPDVITFKGFMTTDGKNRMPFLLRLGEKYEERNGCYYRFPNHIVPMKRDLVKSFRFPDLTMGEDYHWAKRIHDAGVLKTEQFIDKEMYHYDFKRYKNV
ncbi:MAG: glycosyltransferase family 2 protein [Burkholderiaceae bacterium]|nr:glycosyltransferase family 2 protein [Burkholderiaceae bacterium]